MTKIVDYANESLLFAEGVAPATPGAAQVRVYAKADGRLYSKNDSGVETSLGTSAAGDVEGPASSTDSHVALFDGTTGKTIKDGGALAAIALSGDVGDLTGFPGGTTTFMRADGAFASPAAGMTNPMTTAGDMIVGGASGAPGRVAAGTNGYVWTMVAGSPAWAAIPAQTIKVTTTVTSNTITPAGDTDVARPPALSAGLTIANPSSTPQDGWPLVLELKDNGTSRTLTWGSKYASRCGTLPTATTAGKQHIVVVSYNATDDKLYCDVASVQA